MGVSHHRTRLDLYEEKILPAPKPEEQNFVAERGNRFEPKIRALFEVITGDEYEVATLVSDYYSWMRASLDGRNKKNKKKIIEIKLVGNKINPFHDIAKTGKVPDCYYPQVQHALHVSQAEICYYLSYHDPKWNELEIDPKNLCVIEVKKDYDYTAKLIEKELDFVEMVKRRHPPEAIKKDYKSINGYKYLIQSYADAVQKNLSDIENLKNEIIEIAKTKNHPRVIMNGLKIEKVKGKWALRWV